jgi:3-deoxy-D-manno-octulosonic-acid transferase
VPAGAAGVAVWVHAVSVGESLAALPLIRALVEQHGERRVWVTTTTPTGSERIRATLGNKVLHSYAPYDLPLAVLRFLDRVHPARVVIMETELWPTLFRALRTRRIPLMIANARLSPRSHAGYGRVAGFAREVLSDVSLVAAQSDLDAERFRTLGAPRVEVTGNLKFDVDPPQAQLDAGAALRQALGAARPVWCAASTHEGEETTALAAHAELRRTRPDALLILVPRHPQRFDEVARRIRQSGDPFTLRSTLSLDFPLISPAPVLLGDSLGEMWMYLAASDLAFVGGSLVPVGGHNVLEPAALGLPTVFGPHMHNFLAARELLLGCDAAREVQDDAALGTAVADLLRDADARRRMGEAGRAAVLANRGTLARLLLHLEHLN